MTAPIRPPSRNLRESRSYPYLLVLLLTGLGVAACEVVERPVDIFDAARAGDEAGVMGLVEQNPALVSAKDMDGMTPLHFAVREGHLEVAAFLLEKGGDVGARDAEERTPLHHAATEGDPAVVELLLHHGSDVTSREFRGRTPLFLACNWGENPETVRLLLDAGADVNDRTPTRGEEILFSTLFYGMPEIIDLLLDRGARLPEDDGSITQAVYISASNGLERVFRTAVETSEERGLPWWEQVPFHTAARGGSVAIAETLLDRGIDPLAINLHGVTPLHVAAKHGHMELVEFLVGQGAVLDQPDFSGMTPLHLAQENEHGEVARTLIELGSSEDPRVFPEMHGPYLGQTEPQPGEGPLRFAPGIVSEFAFNSEHSPAVFSPDGTEVYWTRWFRGPILRMHLADGVWTPPAPAPFGSEHGDGEPIFTPDGRRIYFLSMRPLEPGGIPGKENIWYVERSGGGWTAPRPVSPAVNSFDHHWLISLTYDETLYFSSVREGGVGGNDLYRSRFVNGAHLNPENLGPIINTEGGEHTPFIGPDESYLIFASSGHPGGESLFTFFISYRSENGTWETPISLAEEMGFFEDPLCPAVTPDGRFMFFIGRGDIWWMDAEFIERLRPDS